MAAMYHDPRSPGLKVKVSLAKNTTFSVQQTPAVFLSFFGDFFGLKLMLIHEELGRVRVSVLHDNIKLI